jgi:putative acetyltransferase
VPDLGERSWRLARTHAILAGMTRGTRPEIRGDAAAVRDVIRRAFTSEVVVADLWDALRERGSVGIVAVEDEAIVGHVGLTWCWLDAPERLVDVLVLSPLSVAPEAQRSGHGGALLGAARAKARELGAPLLFLEGDPAFYSRFGFRCATEIGITSPSDRIPGPAFQVVELPTYDPLTMTGRLVYADPFWAFDCVGLRSEQTVTLEDADGGPC